MVENLNKRITNIFRRNLGEDVIDIIDCSKGIEQVVKIVETKKNKYIFKLPHQGNELMVYRENFACSHIKNVPVPKIVAKGRDYIIESFIAGQLLNELKLSHRNQAKIYKDLGRYINQIHRLKMHGFGELQNNGRGKYSTPVDYLESLLKYYEPSLLKTKLFNRVLIKRLRSYLRDNITLFTNESVLLHGDLIDDNILINNNTIYGVIDFGDAVCGPREYDLAKIYIEKNNRIFTWVLYAYGKELVNLKKVRYFAVFHLMYMVPYFYSTNKVKYVKYIRLMNSLINNKG